MSWVQSTLGASQRHKCEVSQQPAVCWGPRGGGEEDGGKTQANTGTNTTFHSRMRVSSQSNEGWKTNNNANYVMQKIKGKEGQGKLVSKPTETQKRNRHHIIIIITPHHINNINFCDRIDEDLQIINLLTSLLILLCGAKARHGPFLLDLETLHTRSLIGSL